jgi:hypothetical protein
MPASLLTDTAVRKAAPRSDRYYLPDGRGLYLYISQTGTKLWRLRYRLNGKPRTVTIGEYPDKALEPNTKAPPKVKIRSSLRGAEGSGANHWAARTNHQPWVVVRETSGRRSASTIIRIWSSVASARTDPGDAVALSP